MLRRVDFNVASLHPLFVFVTQPLVPLHLRLPYLWVQRLLYSFLDAVEAVEFGLFEELFFEVEVNLHEEEGVSDEGGLYFLVEGGFGGEGGRVVDFEEEGLHLCVDEDVQSEDVEGHVVVVLLGLALDVVVPELFVPRYYRLDGDVLDLFHQSVRVMALLPQQPQHRGEAALELGVAALAVGGGSQAGFELGVLFVDGVVGEVLVVVGHVVLVWLGVLLGGEPGQPFVVKVYPEGRKAPDQDVYPEVELEVLDEQGVRQVLLHDAVLAFAYF